MNNLLKLTILFTLLAIFVGCEDNDPPVIEAPSGLELLNPGIQEFKITSENSTSTAEALKLTWDNFTSTSSVTVDMALDPDFTTVQTFTPTAVNYMPLTFTELNTAVANLGGVALVDNAVYFRVLAGEIISNSVSFNVNSTTLPAASPILTNPTGGETFTIDPATVSETATTATWNYANSSDFSVSYEVQVALAGTSFASVVVVGTTSDETSFDISNSALNNAAIQAGIEADSTGDLDIRVSASYDDGENSVTTYSDLATITVTPTFILPRLAVPGNHQGWQPDENVADFVPYIAASEFGATDYEGFMWLDGEYKYVEPNDEGNFVWGNTDWGDDGSFSGLMVSEGEINFPSATAGYYLVRGDTATGIYSREVTDWGIIGDATPGGWDSDTDMSYDSSSMTWTIMISLNAGAYKFRANDDWPINLGTDSDGNGSLDFGGPNFGVDTAGTYLVTLDLSNPRQYTASAVLQ